MLAYACLIDDTNFQAIASEHPKFDLEGTKKWIEQHKRGYFLRDESSQLDCHYFQEDVFLMLYKFESADRGELFRRVDRI